MSELYGQLLYGSRKHHKIVESLRSRLRMSERRMKDRYAQMSKNEEQFQAYIPETEADKIRKTNRDSVGTLDYRTVEIPYTFAVLMTAHTYYTSVFLARDPVMQLQGRHGEAEQKVQAMEALMSYQMNIGRNIAPLFTWLLDPGKYGFGVVGHHWDHETIRIRKKVKEQQTFMGVPIDFADIQETEVVEDVAGYQGNRTYNVRPQDFFPDTRVALVNFHQGEFCARYVEIAWNELYEGSKSGRYFNFKVLKEMRAKRDLDEHDDVLSRDMGSDKVGQLPEETWDEAGYEIPLGFVKSYEIYIKLVPSDWRLGTSDRQEVWVFNLTSNGVLFGAQGLGELHGQFPFDILTDEIDGYTVFPRSGSERVTPLNDVITWLVNTHFYNVRQTLNNQFIVDPSMVVMKDVEAPGPGKIIRLKPQAFGRDIRTVITQLQNQDVTRTHMADIPAVVSFIQQILGVNDNIMGAVNSGGRKTATEVRTSTTMGINRLKTQCEWFSEIGFKPYTQKMVQRTQELYSGDMKMRLVGDLGMMAPGVLQVTPDMIAGFFDYIPVDGTMPIDRFAQANLWKELFAQAATIPQIAAGYDLGKIFAWIASLGGLKNLSQFRLQVQPDDQLQRQAQAGNVVPLSQVERNPNEPKQIPNMGATG